MSRMPFREKLKKAFKSSSPTSSKNPSPTIVQNEPTRWPSNVYRPDEPMPRPKYRAPVKKEHKEKLEAFNFGSSWRRRSHVSLYSPMGSRLPSRRGSRANRDSVEARRKSVAQQSGKTGGSTSRSNSITSSFDPRPKPAQRAAQPTSLQPEPEQYGDDDVGNVGLSRIHSREKPPRISISSAHSHPSANDQSQAAAVSDARPGSTGVTQGGRNRSYGHGRTRSDEYGSASSMQEASFSKKDSGPPSQHLVGLVKGPDADHIDHKMFTEDDLVQAMSRNRMGSTVAL